MSNCSVSHLYIQLSHCDDGSFTATLPLSKAQNPQNRLQIKLLDGAEPSAELTC